MESMGTPIQNGYFQNRGSLSSPSQVHFSRDMKVEECAIQTDSITSSEQSIQTESITISKNINSVFCEVDPPCKYMSKVFEHNSWVSQCRVCNLICCDTCLFMGKHKVHADSMIPVVIDNT